MLSWNIEKKEINLKQYSSGGMYSFINRYTDTGFKTKWCGIWMPPIKAFEYFAYRINETWLSEQNCTRCSIKPWGTKHHFLVDDLNITEIVFAPDDYPSVISVISIKNMIAKERKVKINIEAAVNMRTKQENVHDRKYETEFNELRKSVIVKSSAGECMYGVGRTEKDIEICNVISNEYKNHSPGSSQCCFIPGKYEITFDLGINEEVKIPIVYCATTKSRGVLIDIYDKCVQNWDKGMVSKLKKSIEIYHDHDINTPHDRLDKTYLWAQYSLQGLISKSDAGTGIFAGYPWFLEYWGRDIFWSLLGLIDMGRFKVAREIFQTIAKFQDKRMPCIVHLDGKKEYHGVDIDPLFLITLLDYEKKSGDLTLRKELKKNIAVSLKNLVLMDYIVAHESNETWMDSIERSGSAIEVQAMWVEALKTIEPKLSMKMNNKLNQNFWNDNKKTYYDTYSKLPNPEITANELVPLFFGLTPQAKAQHVLERTKTELKSVYGIRTRSKMSRNYNSSGYHTGSCWGLTTGWGAVAFLRYGMISEGINCLDDCSYDCEKFQPGGLSEIVDAKSGKLLGATDQAWSSSLFIYAVDDFLFGIRPDVGKKMLAIEPKLPDAWGHMYRHGKVIGDNIFDLKVERSTDGIEIRIDFRQKPKNFICELTMPEWINQIMYKGKKTKKRKCRFSLEKENVVLGFSK